jgi:hypothetical protein
MVGILDREVELVPVSFRVAAELATAVGQHTQQLGIVLLEERQHPVVQEIGRRDRRLAIIELGEGDLGIGIDEGLLIDAPDPVCAENLVRLI